MYFLYLILLIYYLGLTQYKYAMLGIWKAWGIIPQVIYARGVGVYSALCLTGILNIQNKLLSCYIFFS
jgi:hypothetical protein